jgi:cell division protein FtsI/penicillin-binding protein 2
MVFRLRVSFLLFLLAAVALVGRLFSLQVHEYGILAAFARGQQQVVETLEAERGKIFGRTRDGSLSELATNRDWQRLYAVPREIGDVQKTVAALRDILGLDAAAADALSKRLSQHDDPYEPIAEKVSDEQASRIREAGLSGIALAPTRGRFYPNGSRLAHVLGFVGYDEQGNRRGVYGIESFFEEALRGIPGMIRGERDGRGRVLEAFSSGATSPQPGADIILTVDPTIQYQAEKYLRETVEEWGAQGGSVIIMEPQTGAIRALANEPTFDPNAYGKTKDPSFFTNAAVSIPYEPGSVFKPITMAAALDAHAVTPETTYENTGSVTIGGATISNVLQQYNGRRSMVDVLRYSLNTGAVFAEEKTGHETFAAYVRAFGFGEPTGITLPSEASGSLTNLSSGRPINFATASFGQGISVTPLQLVRAIGAIANGGMLMKPFIVDAIEYPDGRRVETQPEAVRRVIEQKTATQLAAMMTRVVEDGTGVRAKIPGYSIAGKTGTAQIPRVGSAGYEADTIHTFVGFFPAFDPRYVILTKVDRPHARYAESTAVPLFRKIAEFLMSYAAIPPDRPLE